MNAFMNRLERVRSALAGRERGKPTLVYADGFQRSMGTLEAVEEISSRADVVDVLAQNETTRSLLLAMERTTEMVVLKREEIALRHG